MCLRVFLLRILSAIVLGTIIAAGPAAAQESGVSDVVRTLRAEGFQVTRIGRTWLGRIRIEAENNSSTREVIVSRSTGEILQDATFPGTSRPRFGRNLRDDPDSAGAREGSGPQRFEIEGLGGD